MTELELQQQTNNYNNMNNNDNTITTNDTKKDKSTTSLPPHPLGVKPMGNIYLDKFEPEFDSKVRERGLGSLNLFDDSFILEIINLLEAKDLTSLMKVSKPFYIFCNNNEIWKQLVINKFGGEFNFKKNWKFTYLNLINNNFYFKNFNNIDFKLKNFYSDVLYQPWVCTATPLDKFLTRDNIPRRCGLSLEGFINEFEKPNKPVILTDVVTKWPAFGKWNESYLREKFGEVIFRAEAIDITLNNYFDYAKQNEDESPIYLFDKKFGENCPSMLEDFSVPEYFSEDLFSLLGDQRPDYRWIIIGPKRSGSTFHKDPNSTSAWNAVITGSKFWIMFPPEISPPGVFTNSDESEVTSPVSIMEWFLNFHKYCKKWEVKPIQGICKAGEVIFVPNGWWHLVVNLEDSIALTQNYVSSQNISNVLKFLRDKKDQVSGCELGDSLFDKFSKVYEQRNPELVEKIREGGKKDEKSNWENLTQEAHSGNSFSFGFNFS